MGFTTHISAHARPSVTIRQFVKVWKFIASVFAYDAAHTWFLRNNDGDPPALPPILSQALLPTFLGLGQKEKWQCRHPVMAMFPAGGQAARTISNPHTYSDR